MLNHGLRINASDLVEYLSANDGPFDGRAWDELEQALAAVMQPIRSEIEQSIREILLEVHGKHADFADEYLIDGDWATEITATTDPKAFAQEIMDDAASA